LIAIGPRDAAPELLRLVGGASGPVALVGAGGKTSSMFALARAAAEAGARVLVTTTTRILDPSRVSEREGAGFGRLLIEAEPMSEKARARIAAAGDRVVLAAGIEGDKLVGIAPDEVDALAPLFDLCLVEADGSRGLPIKAPSDREPVIPQSAAAVLGFVGLEALGAPMDGRAVHRPELFGPLVGCALGSAIRVEHVVALAFSPEGLFKGAPRGASRIVVLNKADLCPPEAAEECRRAILESGAADEVVIGAAGAAPAAAKAAASEASR
jgi:probable selenium-dependent hydroxylase accessory protein YqeC